MQLEFNRFFHDYAAAFNRSLDASVDDQAIMSAFADHFISAGPAGVQPGSNGEEFREALHKAYAFYKQVGTRRMSVRGLNATPIDELHSMVQVSWTADYEPRGKQPVSIDFEVTYLLQTLPGKTPRIFAFVAGDEMALLKQRGVIDAGIAT